VIFNEVDIVIEIILFRMIANPAIMPTNLFRLASINYSENLGYF